MPTFWPTVTSRATVIAALLNGGWYAACRWLKLHPPDWLTRILLGSAKAPVYESHQKINVNSDYADRSPTAGTTLDLGATERLPHDDQ